MRKLLLIVGAVVLVIVIGGGAAVWYFFLRDSAPPAVALEECEGPVEPASDGASPDGTWELAVADPDADTFVGYRIQELFAGDTLERTAAGRTPAVDGTMTITDNRVTEVEIAADVTQLDSDQQRRDDFIEDSALETNEFPEARFVMTDPIALDPVPATGETVCASPEGQLTMHGVTRTVVIELNATWDGDTIDVTGRTPILLTDYDIEAPDTNFVSVEDNGEMEFQLTFRRT